MTVILLIVGFVSFRYRRTTHVTPKSYLSFLGGYKSIYLEQRQEIADLVNRLSTGLEKLEEAQHSIHLLSQELVVKEKELEISSLEAEEVLKEACISNVLLQFPKLSIGIAKMHTTFHFSQIYQSQDSFMMMFQCKLKIAGFVYLVDCRYYTFNKTLTISMENENCKISSDAFQGTFQKGLFCNGSVTFIHCRSGVFQMEGCREGRFQPYKTGGYAIVCDHEAGGAPN